MHCGVRLVDARRMRTKIAHIAAQVNFRISMFWTQWWGGVGCRISFMMSLAIVLVVALLGSFLLWEGRRNQQAELHNRLSFIGSYFSSLAVDDILSEDRKALYEKLSPAFLARGSIAADLAYVIVYNRTGHILVANAPRDMITTDLGRIDLLSVTSAVTIFKQSNPLPNPGGGTTYEMTMPVLKGDVRVGYVRIGISGRSTEELFDDVTKHAIIVIVPILIVGLLFSQVIAAGIVKPIQRLSTAVDALGKQSWKTPLAVRGKDEIARLAKAFNQVALTLQQRETSLSQGNRDLFILHTAGLDLMESLDLKELLARMAARAEDLIRADTTAVSIVDRETRTLRYIGVQGGRAQVLLSRELPLEAGGIYNWMASYGTPLLVTEASRDFRLDADDMRSLGIRSLITVPLWSSNSMIALLTALNKKGAESFDKHDLRLFTVFSSIAGAALQNAMLYADLKKKMGELTTMQQQLVHSTKMAAIGELAANVAHEINNPLTSVLGYTSHLIRTLDLPEESLQKLRLMEQETLRVRKIIRNLLDFSRQRTSRKRTGDVLEPLRETVALLHGVADRSQVRMHETYPEGPILVWMDHNEMKQVFINIMNNALHAMPEGGTLHMRVQVLQDNRAVIEFEDTGLGIPEENRGKIFEPFFSTKHEGDGTGLGLSISERIVQNHGGHIHVESAVGRGSLFRIVLPMHAEHLVHQE